MAYLLPEHWGGILKSVVDENIPSGHIYVTPQLLENNEGAFMSALRAEMAEMVRGRVDRVDRVGRIEYLDRKWAREGIVVEVH